MTIRPFLSVIFLLTYLVGNVKCKEKTYCYMSKHEYYLPSVDVCKKCDRCIPGTELEPIKQSTFEISMDHGPLGCRKCIRCQSGYFNNKRTYGGCKACRDCETMGRLTKKACTKSSNAKCGEKKQQERVYISTTEKMTSFPTTEDPRSREETSEQSDLVDSKVVAAIISCLIVTMIAVSLTIFIHCHGITFRGLKKSRNGGFSAKPNSNNEELEDLVVGGGSPVKHQNMDGINFDEKGGSEMLTEKQLMFVAKLIATKKCYKEVAIDLGVSEINICIIEEENKNDCINISFKVLQKWTQVLPNQATVAQLLKSLQAIGRNDIVKLFSEEYYNMKDCKR